MDNDNQKRNEEINPEEGKKQKPRFNAGHNDADYDGGHPSGFIEEDEDEAVVNEGTGSFNSGGNDSDFDGGHPGDTFPSKN